MNEALQSIIDDMQRNRHVCDFGCDNDCDQEGSISACDADDFICRLQSLVDEYE